MLKPDTSQIVADVGLGMRDFTGLLTLIGSDAVDNSMGRIAIDPLSFMMSVISSFGLIGLTRNLLKQAIGKYNCEALGFDIRGIMSTYKNPFNNEFYNLRGLIRCRVLTENGLENIPGS
ncbi:20921_t:CDS:1, partial [Gigaspora margarita]